MQTKKHTAWKKSRKFGDVYGGRRFPHLVDNIFNRLHNLLPPVSGQEVPIYMMDNPSRDFYFPVSVDDIQNTLAHLPAEHTSHLTHIWLQKTKKADYISGNALQGAFVSGSGVNLIILRPFPISNKMFVGCKKPEQKVLNYYKSYTTDLRQDANSWYLVWTREDIRKYYLESLLLHEVGHAVDSYYKRYWSKAAVNKIEKYADNYAMVWGNTIRQTVRPKIGDTPI